MIAQWTHGWRMRALLVVAAMLLMVAPVWGGIFTDITALPAQRAIERLTAKGIFPLPGVRGAPDKFNPAGTVTRGELAVFLVRTLGFSTQGLTLPNFKDAADIPRDQAPAIAAMASLGSVSTDKAELKKGALIYTLTTDKKVYAPNEQMLLTFTVENTGKEPVKFDFVSDLHFDFIIRESDGTEVARASIGSRTQRGDQSVSLAPGGKFKFEKFWKQLDQNDEAVPAGRYEIVAVHKTKSDPTTVAIVFNKGVMAAFPDNTFRSKEEITRLDLATITARAMGLPDAAPSSLTVTDANTVPTASRGTVAAALAKNLLTPVGNREFRPAAKATRSELAQSLDVLMDTLNRYNFSKGTLKDPITGNPPQITIEDERKALRTFRVARTNAVYRNDRPAELRDLRPGDTLRFLNVGDVGDVAYIEATGR